MSFIGLDKLAKIFRIIKFNGGVINSLKTLYRTEELKIGTLIGVDSKGNKYYENNEYFYGRNRWVDYNVNVGVDYDGSMVTPEWYGWLHYKTDLPPTVKPRVNYKWIEEASHNKSGTSEQYVPYSTTRPKIQPWVPPPPKKSS